MMCNYPISRTCLALAGTLAGFEVRTFCNGGLNGRYKSWGRGDECSVAGDLLDRSEDP